MALLNLRLHIATPPLPLLTATAVVKTIQSVSVSSRLTELREAKQVLESCNMTKLLSFSTFVIFTLFVCCIFAEIIAPANNDEYTETAQITIGVGSDPAYAGKACIINVLKRDANGDHTIVIASTAIAALDQDGESVASVMPAMGAKWPQGSGSIKVEASVIVGGQNVSYGHVYLDIVP